MSEVKESFIWEQEDEYFILRLDNLEIQLNVFHEELDTIYTVIVQMYDYDESDDGILLEIDCKGYDEMINVLNTSIHIDYIENIPSREEFSNIGRDVL